MSKLVESVGRPNKQQKSTKLCLRCGRVKDINDYYNHKDWSDQLGKDVWCKECVNRCATKDEIKEYFWENHREWNNRIWDQAKSKAEKLAVNNLTFQKASDERRKTILERLTCQQVPSCMTAPSVYKYIDHEDISYLDAKIGGQVVEEVNEDKKVYSREFNGYFNSTELEYLESYYTGLDRDYALDTENLQDYARKICKASLQADKAQADFATGKCDFSVVKDAMAIFDMLSKSANFAACKRKPGDNGGLGSWSELTLKLETSGHPCTEKIEWEPDDVDKTLEEFRYIVQSLGLDMQ